MTNFDLSLDLLDEPLRTRALALRMYAVSSSRGIRGDIAELIGLAFDAAYVGDNDAAAACLAEAETLVRSFEPSAGEASDGKQEQWPRLWLHGRVQAPAGGCRPVAATDGSYRKPWAGWAYVATTGHWGLRAGNFSGALDPNGNQPVLITELRAAMLAICDIPGPLTVLADSMDALRFLAAWQAGDTGLMPDGYSLRPRTDGRPPALALLAETVFRRHGELAFEHVRGHAGHLLNEAADALARMAQRRIRGAWKASAPEVTARAEDLTATFLRSWQEVAA